ncbi:alpha/beta hydrolase [Pseudomonas sp. R5(2019)]|uniref:alpha/beta hydrolase n=1 Tax=Pseudomonas sp. R5(2019) TaxID=2697566 RepID=UPI00353187F5
MHILATLAALYLLLCLALFVFQRALIYFPQPGTRDSPATRLQLPVADATLQVSTRPHDGPNALIYFGGNAEDVSLNLVTFSQAFTDQAIYLMHYRGFGGSTGSPSEQALQRDALALFDKVHATHPHITVIGRSLGTGVAVRLASQRPAAGLVLITPYNSLVELAERHYPFVPVKWLLKDTFESWKYAPLITVPTLLIAAEHDEVVPRSSTERLYTHFVNGVASLKVIPGVNHNSISESPDYLEMIENAL